MKICLIKDCGKKHWAKGYCNKHYTAWKRYGNPLKILVKGVDYWKPRYCKICNKRHYAKGYCHNHWANWIRCGNPLGFRPPKKVINVQCITCGKMFNKPTSSPHLRNFCSRKCSGNDRKGIKNFRWNGGVSEYPNHYEFKQKRLLVLQRSKGKCEICNRNGIEVHHKDGSKKNHDLKNLILICKKCHCLIHSGRKNKTSKFIRLYGATLEELSTSLNIGSPTIYRLHKENKLNIILTKQNKVLK